MAPTGNQKPFIEIVPGSLAVASEKPSQTCLSGDRWGRRGDLDSVRRCSVQGLEPGGISNNLPSQSLSTLCWLFSHAPIPIPVRRSPGVQKALHLTSPKLDGLEQRRRVLGSRFHSGLGFSFTSSAPLQGHLHKGLMKLGVLMVKLAAKNHSLVVAGLCTSAAGEIKRNRRRLLTH